MTFDSIDTLFVAVRGFEACRGYEKLGLHVRPALPEGRFLLVGQAHNLVAVRFLADASPDSPLSGPVRHALAAGRGLFAVGLRVADLDAALARLAAKGIQGTRFPNGEHQSAWLALHEQAGTDLVLVQQRRSPQEGQAFPLRRLDHLATVAHDLEAKARFWADVLGVPAAGEVRTPATIIRQLRIGDAVLELLGPASADSPIRQRPAGLVSMASWEVGDLDAAVRQARGAGFAVPDAAEGPLPGTRIATIPGGELAGVNMQLLHYV